MSGYILIGMTFRFCIIFGRKMRARVHFFLSKKVGFVIPLSGYRKHNRVCFFRLGFSYCGWVSMAKGLIGAQALHGQVCPLLTRIVHNAAILHSLRVRRDLGSLS